MFCFVFSLSSLFLVCSLCSVLTEPIFSFFFLSMTLTLIIGFTLVFLPTLANYNKKKLYFWGCLCSIPAALMFPLLPYIDGVKFGWLVTCMTFKNISLTLAFTSVCVQVSNSVEDNSEELAAVNGIGQSMASFSRAIGPAFGGLLWSSFLINKEVYGNFILVCTVFVVCMIVNWQLPNKE